MVSLAIETNPSTMMILRLFGPYISKYLYIEAWFTHQDSIPREIDNTKLVAFMISP